MILFLFYNHSQFGIYRNYFTLPNLQKLFYTTLIQDEERFSSLLQQIIEEELHHEMFKDIKNIIPFSKTTLAQKPKFYENLLQREYSRSFLTMVIHDENKIAFSDVFENFVLINTMIIKQNI